MQDFPETRHSLLVRIQHDERDAWAEFATIYRPMIYRLARRRGWQDADAQDVAQKVLVKVSHAIPGFQPSHSQARFRTWLTTVCKNTMVDELRRRNPDVPTGGLTTDFPYDDYSSIADEEITLEHRRQVFRWAAAKASDSFATATWLAFWRTAVEGVPVRDVATELDISVGAVYTARSRVMQFLKQKVREYDDAEV